MLSLLEKPALSHLIGPTSPMKLLGSFTRDSIEELEEKKQNFNPIRNKKFRNFSQNEKVASLNMNNIHSLSFNHGYLSPYFINHPLKKDV